MKHPILLVIAPLLPGCMMLNSGNVSSGPLLSVNDKYVDIAKGKSKTHAILGLSDVLDGELILDAKRDMFRSRPLQHGEYYANFTSDISRVFWLGGVVIATRVTVSAEVLRSAEYPVAHPDSSSFSKVSLNFTGTRFVYRTDTFRLQEKVYYKTGSSWKEFTISAINRDRVSLSPLDTKRKPVEIDFLDELYSTTKILYGFKAGDRVRLTDGDFAATILGISGNRFLLGTDYKMYVKPVTGFRRFD
jgi:hypothetical protein